MNTATINRLVALQGCATLYEVTLSHNGKSWLVCYCRRTRPGLVNALTRCLTAAPDSRRLDAVSAIAEVAPADWRWTGPHSLIAGQSTIQFSGRTQREAICNTELDYCRANTPTGATV